MKRRLTAAVLVALPLAALVVTAAPAAACQPENEDACRRCAETNRFWSSITGQNLMHCPM